jgi:ssDNA-binding Zn-finger/Zn-ribbon topoisomerase 1
VTYNRYRCPHCQKHWWMADDDRTCPDCGTECVEESEQ